MTTTQPLVNRGGFSSDVSQWMAGAQVTLAAEFYAQLKYVRRELTSDLIDELPHTDCDNYLFRGKKLSD
jgi:hypothetical protein